MDLENKQLRGIAVSPGYGMGNARIITPHTQNYTKKRTGAAQDEHARLRRAFDDLRTANNALIEKIKMTATQKEADILAGQLQLLDDPEIGARLNQAIEDGASAEGAADKVFCEFADLMARMNDPLLSERATDLRDLRTRLIDTLTGGGQDDLNLTGTHTVLVTRELTPSMTARLDLEGIVGIVTEQGAPTAHAAILARAMSIPSVSGVANFDEICDGDALIVDGCGGIVHRNAPQDIQKEYCALREQYLADQNALKEYKDRPGCTADGVALPVFANIGSVEEARAAHEQGAEGIGLFRTEFLFLGHSAPPDEEEQYTAYCDAARAAGVPLIIRTIDVGGDKDIPYLELAHEENPFLGLRGIRFALAHKELLRTQLRAILRAGAEYPISAMLPMICDISEVTAAREMMEDEAHALGVPPVSLGIMIETPAAVLCAAELARAADFFSIGTNDLTGYTLCTDRGNPAVAYLYSAHAPAVLRAIRHTVRCAHAAGIPVSVCGEAAADEQLLPFLIGCGIDKISVTPAAVLRTRKVICTHSAAKARALAERTLLCESREECTAFLHTNTESGVRV